MIVDTLISARWVIPVEPDGLVLENHTLAIVDGKIIDLLPQSESRSKYRAESCERFDKHVLIPGLVNAHTHSPMSNLRGIADDLPLMEWLNDHIWPLERKWMSEKFVADGTELAIAEMLRGGTTCFNDMYFFPEVSAKQALKVGIRANIGLILIDFPSHWAQNPVEYLSKGLKLHDELVHEALISTLFAPHAPYTVSDQSFKKMRTFADELDLPIHIHLHETQHEIDDSLKQYNMRPLQRLHKLGLLRPNLLAVHMTQLNDNDIDLFAKSGGSVVHCPESNLKLAAGMCPVTRFLETDTNVALGTDSAASNNDLDMLGETRIAALLAKGISKDASAVPAKTALRLATLNGAKALGLEGEIGSLEIGKSADMAAIDLDTLETLPLFDPLSQIVYSSNRNQVTDVWVAGKRLMKSRKLTTLDIDEVLERTQYWSTKLKEK